MRPFWNSWKSLPGFWWLMQMILHQSWQQRHQRSSMSGKRNSTKLKKGIYCSINFLCLRPEKETEWSFFSFVQELYLCICKIVKGGVWLVCIVICHPMDWPGAAQSSKTFLQKGDKMTKLWSKTAGQGGHVTVKEGVGEFDSMTDFER